MNKEKELIDKLIDLAFAEDIGDGDHTTLSCIPATAMGKSKLLIKEAGVLAGIEVAKEIFNRFDPTMKVEVFINDGTEVKPGDVAMVVEGKVQSLLQTERLMLNVMQRMSGIATMTRKYAKVLEGTNTRVLELRDQYYNMREKIEPVMHIIDTAFAAMEAVGVKPNVKPIRGGTDGAQLSFKGLPCPNIFAGGLNFHGRYEFVPIQNMEKAMKVIVKIAELVASK